MTESMKQFLFNKHYLVAEGNPENAFETIVTLAVRFGIRVKKNMGLATVSMIKDAASFLGEYVPEPFYRGFPNTVRELTNDQRRFDQLLHYFTTYGFGDFSEAGHSIFEEKFERLAFQEDFEYEDFEILTEAEAEQVLFQGMKDLLSSPRPLNDSQFELVLNFANEYDLESIIDDIPCKKTAAMLLCRTRKSYYANFLNLSDVMKVVEYLEYARRGNENLKKLNMQNWERKLVKNAIETCFLNNRADIRTCFEKRKLWCGLLHHIHFKSNIREAHIFANIIRNGENMSVYHDSEALIHEGYVVEAARVLRDNKGTSVLLRNLNYLLSRCETEEDIEGVFACLK